MGGTMYKVVIIDDEPIIVEGISRSIKWDEYNCQVVGTAGNGMEGLEVIRREKPDIIFSDICMPNMDGLLMIAAIKSEFKDIEITILTGFRDFDYAYQAIKLGVTRFLLKPSKMDELKEAITAMTANLDAKRMSLQPDASGAAGMAATKEPLDKADEAACLASDVDACADDEGTASMNSEAGNFIVHNAMKYIEEHYSEKLKLSDVADKVFVSQWHLSKLLNRQTGQNFSEILNGIRIEKAKLLLEDPSLRIGDIADTVGFLDMAHFSRVFKKQTGISANEYRNKVLSNR